jgi:hypothetical protein
MDCTGLENILVLDFSGKLLNNNVSTAIIAMNPDIGDHIS